MVDNRMKGYKLKTCIARPAHTEKDNGIRKKTCGKNNKTITKLY